MQQYLGICMVIVVSGLVIGVLARLVTGGILDEIEKIRQKRTARKLQVWGVIAKDIREVVNESILETFKKETEKLEKKKVAMYNERKTRTKKTEAENADV